MDMKELFAFVEWFEKSGLSELTWKKDGEEICLRKGQPLAAGQTIPMFAPAPIAASAPAHDPAAQPAPSATVPEQGEGTELIKAPLVGTFYRSPAPDAPAFVEEGDTVKRGETLCILEAMKLMNEFQAEFDLEVVRILAENGKMVEFGVPLFEVRRV